MRPELSPINTGLFTVWLAAQSKQDVYVALVLIFTAAAMLTVQRLTLKTQMMNILIAALSG